MARKIIFTEKEQKQLAQQRRWTHLIALAGYKNNQDFCDHIGLKLDLFRDYTAARVVCPPERLKMILKAIKEGKK